MQRQANTPIFTLLLMKILLLLILLFQEFKLLFSNFMLFLPFYEILFRFHFQLLYISEVEFYLFHGCSPENLISSQRHQVDHSKQSLFTSVN